MDERWPGSLFQTLEATDENDLDLAISVFRVGIHSDNEEEDSSDPQTDPKRSLFSQKLQLSVMLYAVT